MHLLLFFQAQALLTKLFRNYTLAEMLRLPIHVELRNTLFALIEMALSKF